ncbi:Uncharacterized protein FWK35_00029175, partial [Aphis craccivora]
IDSVKRHTRSILGINIQYIKNDEITLKTLAMVELFEKHTAENLKQSLLDVRVKYEITREQIYTITCDNAANIMKMTRIMTVNDIGNDFVDSSDEVNDNILDINTDDKQDSDDEYPNDETPISNEDIENKLLIDLFNTDEATTAIQSFEDNVFDALNPSPITSCIDALTPVKIATLALQKQDINLGDFYGVWLKHLMVSNLMIQDDVCQIDDVDNSAIANINVDSSDNTTETTDDGFELFLPSQSSVSSNRSDTNMLNGVSVSLHNFKDVERLHYKTNILAFWESQKHEKPDLYKLAYIVLALPATQVSVEQSFSGIKFILSDLRTSLSAKLLDAIMIIRSNTKFVKLILINSKIDNISLMSK